MLVGHGANDGCISAPPLDVMRALRAESMASRHASIFSPYASCNGIHARDTRTTDSQAIATHLSTSKTSLSPRFDVLLLSLSHECNFTSLPLGLRRSHRSKLMIGPTLMMLHDNSRSVSVNCIIFTLIDTLCSFLPTCSTDTVKVNLKLLARPVLPTISFLKLSLLSFYNGFTDLNSDCCVNIDEKFLWLKFSELRSRNVAIATNFVAPNGDKSTWNAFIVCAGILQRLGRSQNLYPYIDLGCTLYIL